MKKRKGMTEEERNQLIVWQNQIWFESIVNFPRNSTIIWAVIIVYKTVKILMGSDGVFALMSCWLLGSLCCLGNYIFFKIVLSYPILKIYYLRKIFENKFFQDKDGEENKKDEDKNKNLNTEEE